jgi:hypothetical protein
MKRLLYIPFCIALLLACKKDSVDAYYGLADFQTIEGKWYLSAIEKNAIDGTGSSWEPVKSNQADTLIFRSDGVILETDGKPACCAPGTLLVNGSLMAVKPQTALPPNPLCTMVNCVNCTTWELYLSGNEMIVSPCSKPRLKYIR